MAVTPGGDRLLDGGGRRRPVRLRQRRLLRLAAPAVRPGQRRRATDRSAARGHQSLGRRLRRRVGPTVHGRRPTDAIPPTAPGLAVLAVLAGLTGLTAGRRPRGAGRRRLGATLDPGHGYGHGHGMGQWGALGYAMAQDPVPVDRRPLLRELHPHHRPGLAYRQIRVVMTENDGNSVIVTSTCGFTLPGTGRRPVTAGDDGPGAAGTWFDLFTGSSCAGARGCTRYGTTSVSTPVASRGSPTSSSARAAGNLTVPGQP